MKLIGLSRNTYYKYKSEIYDDIIKNTSIEGDNNELH